MADLYATPGRSGKWLQASGDVSSLDAQLETRVMGIYIDREGLEQRIHELADQRGVGVMDAIDQAIRRDLERLQPPIPADWSREDFHRKVVPAA